MVERSDVQTPHSEIEVNEALARELGLTTEEYNRILLALNRVPTYTELGIYSVMWSEHCSYKNSILHIKTLPRSGGRLLVEAGAENAGLVDIGGGYAIAFKIESHNHPSAVEPLQGAATGVGGILRDIFTMGARPIAALNSLRFGDLDNKRVQFLLKGVVHGIGSYGNCFGVPTVAGEVYFDTCYTDNPLVNAMAVGIVKVGKTASATAEGVGNPVFILGSSTGRDGIHGASLLASREFDEQTEDMRPTVQVGDPFTEKLLLEASLELIEAGVVVGMQDMGAAGISCSTSEMSAKGGVGMDIDLDLVPLREQGMSAYEIMLSESQERMLVVVEKGKEEQAKSICDKWDLPLTHIGVVTDTERIRLRRNDILVADLPAQSLVLGGDAPVYDRQWREPAYLAECAGFDESAYIHADADTISEMFLQILSSPSVASKRWIYEQYDQQVRTNTVNNPGSDAGVIRLKEVPGKAIAVTTDCNSRFVYLNPFDGGAAAVAEAARNVVCVGAKPLAITNCLNFGNPYDPEVFFQFKDAIRGIGAACRMFDTPVTGGNVSFHNQSQNHAVFPTPTIGMLGLIEDLSKLLSPGLKEAGDKVVLLGGIGLGIGGSEYLKIASGQVTGKCPTLDLTNEKALHDLILGANDAGLIRSAHDCSEGGLATCLAEKCFVSNGLGITVDGVLDWTTESLFGESFSRVVVTVTEANIQDLEQRCIAASVEFLALGTVTQGGVLTLGDGLTFAVADLKEAYESGIPSRLATKI